MFSKEDFRNAVVEGIRRMPDKGDGAIGDDEEFGVYGLDSLDTMYLVLEVENILGISLGELDITDSKTINKFYEKARAFLGDGWRGEAGRP